jgi:hypothetical protein
MEESINFSSISKYERSSKQQSRGTKKIGSEKE